MHNYRRGIEAVLLLLLSDIAAKLTDYETKDTLDLKLHISTEWEVI